MGLNLIKLGLLVTCRAKNAHIIDITFHLVTDLFSSNVFTNSIPKTDTCTLIHKEKDNYGMQLSPGYAVIQLERGWIAFQQNRD